MRSTRKKEVGYSIALLISAALTELHSFLAAIFPSLTKNNGVKRDLFWSPKFKMEIDVLWYIKMICDSIFLMTVLFVGAMVTWHTSKKLFFVFSIFLFYNFFDFFSFLWNYKQTTGLYWIFLFCLIASVLMIIFKHNKIRAV